MSHNINGKLVHNPARLEGGPPQMRVPALSIPAKPTPRKVVSARYKTVSSRVMQPSWRQMQDSSRPKSSSRMETGSFGGSSVAANVAAGKNARVKHRYQPTVTEISNALASRPYLTAQICAIRDDSSLTKAERMTEIGKIVRECEKPVALSDLEKQQANYAPSKERMNGRRAGHSAFSAYVKTNNLEKAEKPAEPLNPSMWNEYGGEELTQMLQYVDLVDARYLLALHDHNGSLPCWGALPDNARINRGSLWRLYGWQARGSLPVVVVSYPWLDYDHPDAQGETLARIAPVLRCMLPLCGGEKFTVGVLIDYASLPQPTRTHAELTRFKLGVRALTMWFAHPHVPVLLVSGHLPTAEGSEHEYKNTRKVEERGWLEFERRLAYLAKSRACLWDIGGLCSEKLTELKDERRRFDLMRSQMMAKVSPPLAPSSFSLMMHSRVKDGRLRFSNSDDLKLVNDMYLAGFTKIFEVYQRCDPSGMHSTWAGHQWEEEEARQVAAALEYAAQKCKPQSTSGPFLVNLEGNHFGDIGHRLIKGAVKFGKTFAGVRC